MDSLDEFIEDAINSHQLADGLVRDVTNNQLYMTINTLITNQSAALQSEFRSQSAMLLRAMECKCRTNPGTTYPITCNRCLELKKLEKEQS